MHRAIFCALLVFSMTACRHPIEIIGEGDVTSASGNRGCLLEEFQSDTTNCTRNNVNRAYNETYYAVPRPGWQFGGWGNYCGVGSIEDQCSFKLSREVVEDFALPEAPPLVAYFRRETDEGHQALLMGHSFFFPFSAALPGDVAKAGILDHGQVTFDAGGAGGAPLSFWNNAEQASEIKAALDEGGFSLLGMTYYPLEENGFTSEDNLQGYRNWIDYALRENENFSVFIGMPWPREADRFTYEELAQGWAPFHQSVHAWVDTLREEYPTLNIYCLPYGSAVLELNKQFELGNVPEIVGEVGDGQDHLHTDTLGHAGAMVFDLVRLVWLRGIYGVDLESYDHGYNYQTNLVAIANRAMNRHNHYYDSE